MGPKKLAYPSMFFLFFLLSIPYLFSDLWMDELLSFWDYFRLPSLGEVVTSYPVANNHIHFSAVMWMWCRWGSPYEPWIRIPCLFFAMATLFSILYWGSGRWKSGPWTVGLSVCASPVLMPFFFQLRGYSFSIFLATLSFFGMSFLEEGKWKRGMALSVPSFLLLPGVLPTNSLLLLAYLLFLSGRFLLHPGRSRGIALLVLSVCATVGFIPYFCIWDQFVSVLKSPLGWKSPWETSGHLVLAALAHGLVLFLAISIAKAGPKKQQRSRWIERLFSDFDGGICACSLLVVVSSVFLVKPSPFPRVFLVFFPVLTIVLGNRLDHFPDSLHSRFRSLSARRFHLLLAVAVLINYFGWTALTDWTSSRKIAQGEYPQNLLEQFYRKSQDASRTVDEIGRLEPGPVCLICTFHSWYTFRHYWRLSGRDPEPIFLGESLPGPNWKRNVPLHLQSKLEKGAGNRLFFIASTQEQVVSFIPREIGKERIKRIGGSGIYKVFKIMPQER